MSNAKSPEKRVVMTVLFLLGVIAMLGFNSNTTYAAERTSSVIGVVNYQLLLAQHPDTAVAQQTINEAVAKAKSDFDTKSVNMSDQDKQALYQQLQQGLQQKNQELLGPISDKVIAAVKSVAEAKGLTVIVDKSSVVYGGQDITDDVIKVITGK
jgi:outer membrane protein